MAEEFEPRDNALWFNIARDFYWGIVAYAIIFLLAFLRDLIHKTAFFKPRRSYLRSVSPTRVYSLYLLQYRDTHVFYYVEFFRLAGNVAVCTLYVLATYHRNVFGYIRLVNRIFAGLFLLDILSVVAAAESAIASVLSWYVFFDVFSFPSLFLASGTDGFLNFSFLRSIAAYGAYSRLERRLLVKIFTTKRLIVKLAFQCFALFYTLAAGIQLLEIPGDLLTVEFRQRWFEYGEWNFFNSAYFVIVTLSTVGYGDFSPSTVQGRLYTLFMIIVGIVIFTSVIGQLVEQSSRGRGSGSFTKQHDSRHVIVTGTPKLSDLVLFVSEFYSDSRQSNADAKVVVLVEDPTWTDTNWYQYIARNQFLQSRLIFLVGSVRNPIDLQRARFTSADAVFFLTSPSTGEEPAQQDSRTVMNILAVRNARTDIPIFAQTLLQDSKLQTKVALSTPSSWSKGTFFRDVEMTKNASYPGLFHMVLKSELEDIPRAHKKEGRACFEDVLKHYNQQQEVESLDSRETGVLSDLHRSRLVCLQETHMALIAANIKVNGVGTLLSNMYLDVQSAKRSSDDPAWLAEYHMGAICSLTYAIVPEILNGVKIKEIALDLYHMGFLLLATSDARHVELRPVLHTDAFLRRGDIAMFLTYHQRQYVGAALFLIALRYKNGELKHSLLSKSSSEATFPDSHSADTHSADAIVGNSGATSQIQGIVDEYSISGRAAVARRDEKAVSTPNLEGDLLAEEHEPSNGSTHCDILGTELLATRENTLQLKCSDGYMPDELRGHVIVAMEGDAPLGNLRLFLINLWRKDRRVSMKKTRKQVVVVIHPSISEQYKSLFTAYEKKSLFFVEGSPSSTETWRRAKLRTAKAVATMADYTQPWHITDAKSVFMLLTLDVNTTSDHDIFICSELLDEKSLEFLREPSHTRRRGAMLGEPVANGFSPGASRERVLSGSEVRAAGGAPQARASGAVRGSADEHRRGAITFQDATEVIFEGIHEIVSEGTQAAAARSTGRDDGAASARAAAAGNPVSAHLATRTAATSRTPLAGLEEALEMPIIGGSVSMKSLGDRRNLPPRSFALGDNAPHAGVDPADRPGAARARRGSLFSRSRYASGELLVHSSAIALLAREYIEPGFSKLFASLLGADLHSPGLKIRLLRIPPSMFSDKVAVEHRRGQRLVPYIHVFRSLIAKGVTPMGIYRSGDAPALIPSRSRKRRGASIRHELNSYLGKTRERKDGAENVRSRGLFSRLLTLVHEITPWKVREAHDRHELHGGVDLDRSSESSDSSDGSDDEDEEYAADLEEAESTSGEGRGVDAGNHEEGQEGKKEGGKPQSSLRRSKLNRLSPRGSGIMSKFILNADSSFEVPGQAKYKEKSVTENLLPYVYTLPDPNTLCAETDGIYVLCHPSFELAAKWSEQTDDFSADKTQPISA